MVDYSFLFPNFCLQVDVEMRNSNQRSLPQTEEVLFGEGTLQ